MAEKSRTPKKIGPLKDDEVKLMHLYELAEDVVGREGTPYALPAGTMVETRAAAQVGGDLMWLVKMAGEKAPRFMVFSFELQEIVK